MGLVFKINAGAAEIYNYNQSLRSLGMGGVHIPAEDDASMMLVNPANLSEIKGIQWTIFDLGLKSNALQYATTSTTTATSVSGASSLSPYYGKPVYVGLGGNSTLAFPYFGFSIYDDGGLGFKLNNPAFPNLNLNYFNDYGYVLGGALPIAGPLSFGLNFKRITRAGGNVNFGPDLISTLTSTTLASSIQNEGTGYGIDAGFLLRSQAPFHPSASVTMKDVGQTAFIRTKGTITPEPIKDSLNLGLTFDGSIPGLGIAGGIEYRDILLLGETIGKKLYMGTELSLPLLDIRAGFGQGYYSYGLGIDLAIFQVDAALYQIETGVYPGQTASQRVAISFKLDLGFDPNFSLTEAGKKKRKVKLRR